MMMLEMMINGHPVSLDIETGEMLVDVLRERLGLQGTKVGCREGECGACTVLLDGQSVNSCLLPAPKAHRRVVVTIEGVGTIERPHPIQKQIVLRGGTQCGYCTPGFVMSGVALLAENPSPTIGDIKDATTGNLCRCTGYIKIIEAIRAAAYQAE